MAQYEKTLFDSVKSNPKSLKLQSLGGPIAQLVRALDSPDSNRDKGWLAVIYLCSSVIFSTANPWTSSTSEVHKRLWRFDSASTILPSTRAGILRYGLLTGNCICPFRVNHFHRLEKLKTTLNRWRAENILPIWKHIPKCRKNFYPLMPENKLKIPKIVLPFTRAHSSAG